MQRFDSKIRNCAAACSQLQREKDPLEIRICEDCKAQSTGEFNQVTGLKNSGSFMFKYNEKLPPIENISTKNKKEERFVLDNAGGKHLKSADYIREMCQYRTKCFQCKTVIQKVRSLLDEINDMKMNEVLGICKYCNRANPMGKCRRCEYIVEKYLWEKAKHNEDKRQRFKLWLSKLNQLLISILEGNVCRHKLYKDTASALELEKLLQELKSPLEMRQLDMVEFPSGLDPFSGLTQSKEMLEDLINKLRSESLKVCSSDSLLDSPLKNTYFKDKIYEDKINATELKATEISPQRGDKIKAGHKPRIDVLKEHVGEDERNKKTGSKKIKDKPSKVITKDKQLKSKNEAEKSTKSPDSKLKKPIKSEIKNTKISSEAQMLLNMLKDREKEKKLTKEKTVKMDKVKAFAKVESLPQFMIKEVVEVAEERSESVFECDHEYSVHPIEMIKKSKIVPYDTHYKDEPPEKLPILYNIEAVFPDRSSKPSTTIATPTSSASGDKENKTKRKSLVHNALLPSGVIKYALSDREFIQKGWTVLPTTKIMRRINIYKMQAASPKYDWFERHKNKKLMFYETGEKLAEIDSCGRGKWYYKNGIVALDYYNTEDINGGQRYVIYSSGEEIQNEKKPPITILASFDYLGNGVVYDHYGQVRLKYNQSEGMVIDDKIGTPGRWQWHSLNEPPILKPVFIDTYVKERNSCLESLLNKNKHEDFHAREPNAEMLAIELNNIAKEKASKLLQKFKPYQIKMKVLKLNECFSLRVLDQSNINLLFRDGKVSMKLNLGMHLISSEIIDTVTAGVSEVATPYDSTPPKSESLAEIQQTLNYARRVGKIINRNTNFEPARIPDASKSFN